MRQSPLGELRPINRNWVTGRCVVDRTIIQVPDLRSAEADFPEGTAYARQYGSRTALAAPLLREGAPIGAILIRRMEVRPFTSKQIALLELFAAQEGRFDYAAIGTVSNVASRLCDEAKPGQILISPRVLTKVENAVEVEPVGEFELKGIRRPLAAYNVVATKSAN